MCPCSNSARSQPVEVERSFPAYKCIHDDDRQRFLPKTIEKVIVDSIENLKTSNKPTCMLYFQVLVNILRFFNAY